MLKQNLWNNQQLTDKKFYFLCQYQLIQNFKPINIGVESNYIEVYYEDPNGKLQGNLYNKNDFSKDFFFIKIEYKNGVNLQFIINKQNFNNGKENRLLTEIKKRNSLMDNVLKEYKINLREDFELLQRFQNNNIMYNYSYSIIPLNPIYLSTRIQQNEENINSYIFNNENIVNNTNIININELNRLLNEERKKNQDLINENSNLKNIIINLKSELAQKDEIKNLLEHQLTKAKEELQKYQSKNFIQTGDSMISINPGDKIFGVNFVSMGNNDIGHFHLICKNTDLFVSLEARLYESYPQFKDFETYFEIKTKRIKRFKTLDENGIKSNDIINIFTVE